MTSMLQSPYLQVALVIALHKYLQQLNILKNDDTNYLYKLTGIVPYIIISIYSADLSSFYDSWVPYLPVAWVLYYIIES